MDPAAVLALGLLVAVALAVGAALAVAFLRRGGWDLGATDVDPAGAVASPDGEALAAVQTAMADLRAELAHDREAATKAVIETVIPLANQALGAQAASGRVELDARKGLIDQQLVAMREDLGKVADSIRRFDRDRAERDVALSEQLRVAAEATTNLSQDTRTLREALASPKARGQWGERMAEDVLRLAGFTENVNYRKQKVVEGGRGIPDFTFDLPKGHVLYLDVKFPLAAYLRHLEAPSEGERAQHRAQFLRDVRLRVRELSARDYLASEGRPVDFVLLFIPNESVNGFIHEADPSLIDEALGQKVVFCSPLTLFAMLGVIRQAHDNFVVERTSDEILRLLAAFDQQWGKFTEQLDKMGRALESTRRAYDELSTTRRRQLERPLGRIEELRAARGVEASPSFGTGAEVLSLPGTARQGVLGADDDEPNDAAGDGELADVDVDALFDGGDPGRGALGISRGRLRERR